jgi:hypothetical protein
VAGQPIDNEPQAEISVEEMLEKMTKVMSQDEIDFWSDCADQISVLSEIIKGSPQLTAEQKVDKLGDLLDEYGYFSE